MKNNLINNRYNIVRTLGEGGMGIVYLIEDTLKNNMHFALKTIKQGVLSKYKKLGLDIFKNEYDIMTRLIHPNLVQVYDFGLYEDTYFILMEYVNGVLLSRYKYCETINERSDECIFFLVQILRALEYVHSRNIVYRDIKPSNIIIKDRDVKLLDFGLSAYNKDRDDAVRGTILYLSPDAMKGSIEQSSDLFSLGLVFFEMLAGESFFKNMIKKKQGIIQLLKNKSDFYNFKKDRISAIRHKSLKPIFDRMIEYDPENRYQNASEIIGDINLLLNKNYQYETDETKQSYVLGNAFANRKKEMKQLIHNIYSKERTPFLIYKGPDGIGKTRLFMEFRKYCNMNRILYFEVNCMEGKIQEYTSIREIIIQLITLSSKSLLKKYNSFLSIITIGDQEDNGSSKINKPEVLKNIILQNMTDYIIEFSREHINPVIIYLNDLQWIDEGSLAILETLLYKLSIDGANKNDLRLYANLRDGIDADHKLLNYIMQSRAVKVLDLLPLDTEGVSEFIYNIFGQKFMDKSIKGSIIKFKERLGGNPLFLKEIIRILIAKDIILKDRRCWKLKQGIEEIDIPDNLINPVRERINKITVDIRKKEVLQVLSLLRIDIDLDVIRKILKNISDMLLNRLLLELERSELIYSYLVQDRIMYSIASSMVKEVVKEGIENKESLSAVIAMALEYVNKFLPYDFNEEIAYQFMESMQYDKAVKYYIICGENAQKNYYNRKAVYFFDLALNLVNSNIELFLNISLKKTNSLTIMGKYDEGLKILFECWEKAKENNKKLYLSRIFNLIGAIKLTKGDPVSSFEFLDKSLELAKYLNDAELLIDIYNNFGIYYFNKTEYERAYEYYSKVMELCREAENKPGYYSALNSIGNIYIHQSKWQEAIECFSAFKAISEKNNNLRDISEACRNLGNVFCNQGEYRKALRYFEQDKNISKKIGDKRAIGQAYGNLGVVYSNMYLHDRAIKCYKAYQKISYEIGYKRGIGVALGNIGSIYFYQGKYQKARECFEEYKNISEEIQDKHSLRNAKLNLGNVYYYDGNYKKALKYYEEAKRIADYMGDKIGSGIIDNNMGNIHKIQGKYTKAIEHFEKCLKISKDIGDKRTYAIVNMNIGSVFLQISELDKGKVYIEDALKIFSEVGEELGVGNSNYYLGRYWFVKKDLNKSLSYTDKAIEIFEKLKIIDSNYIDCLLNKVEIMISKKLIEKAEEINAKALSIAKEINDKKLISKAEDQFNRIRSSLHNC